MKPARFRYLAPQTLDECLELLTHYEDDAQLLAGGQSLVPLMNLRLAQPEVLIDLNHLVELSYVREENEHLEIGALTRHNAVINSSVAQRACPLLIRAADVIGYPAIRNRGTMGGSLAHADPSAELPCIAITLDAEIVATSLSGQRTIPARDFFLSHFITALEPTEVLTAIRLPICQPGDGWDFQEFARKSGDFALMAVAIDLALSHGHVHRARIGIAGAGQQPLRPITAEQELTAQPLHDAEIEGAGQSVADLVAETMDESASDSYHPHIARVLAMRALHGAGERSKT